MTLGEKIQKLRKKHGFSQEQLAGQLNVSRQAVSKWELNDSIPDLEKVIAISELFKVSLDELLMESGVGRDSEVAGDKKGNRKTHRIVMTGLLVAVALLVICLILFDNQLVFETLWFIFNLLLLVLILIGCFFLGKGLYHFFMSNK